MPITPRCLDRTWARTLTLIIWPPHAPQVGVVGIFAAGFAVGSSQLVDDYGAPGMLVSMGAVSVSAALVFFTTVVLSDTN